MSVMIIGTVAYDSIETPFGSREYILGGSGVYSALACALSGAETLVLSNVGDDFRSEDLRLLESKGINTGYVEKLEGEKSFFWRCLYHEDMNVRDTLETQLNSFGKFAPVIDEKLRDCRFVHLANLQPDAQLKIMDQLDLENSFVLLDTMNLWINTQREDLMRVIPQVDLFIINDEEARMLADEKNLLKAAKIVLGMGARNLVIKEGKHGATLFSGGQIFIVPAVPIENVLDPTGAGDCMAGAMTGYLDKTGYTSFEGLKKALVYASTVASFCVEGFGPEGLLAATPDKAEGRNREFIRTFSL